MVVQMKESVAGGDNGNTEDVKVKSVRKAEIFANFKSNFNLILGSFECVKSA